MKINDNFIHEAVRYRFIGNTKPNNRIIDTSSKRQRHKYIKRRIRLYDRIEIKDYRGEVFIFSIIIIFVRIYLRLCGGHDTQSGQGTKKLVEP